MRAFWKLDSVDFRMYTCRWCLQADAFVALHLSWMAVQSGHHQIQIQNQSEALERSGSYVCPYHFAKTRIAAFSWWVCLRECNCMALVEANDSDFLKCRWWKEVNIKVGVTVVPIISIALCALPCAFYVGCLVSIACTALLPCVPCETRVALISLCLPAWQ